MSRSKLLRTFLVFGYFWTLILNSSTTPTLVSFKIRAVRAVQSLLSISYIVFALSSAVTNLSNKTLICYDFQGQTIKFHDIPGLENEMLKFHDFFSFSTTCANPVIGFQSPKAVFLRSSCERRSVTLQLTLLDQQGQN